MKKLFFFGVLLLAVGNVVNAQEFLGPLSPERPVKDIIKSGKESAESFASVVAKDGDYVLEKNLNKFELITSDLEHALGDDIDKVFKDLDEEEAKSIRDLNKRGIVILGCGVE